MSDSVRAFLSVELPKEVKTAIARFVDEVARVRVNGLKPVKRDHVHITLKFFGDVKTEQVKSITNVVTTASKGIRPFTVKLGRVGVYPNSKNARVLWVGLDGDSASIGRWSESESSLMHESSSLISPSRGYAMVLHRATDAGQLRPSSQRGSIPGSPSP
jgi:2'-5' RNA ligase